MSGYNLPPGCSLSDIPGNNNLDVFIERYCDDHYNDADMFNEYIENQSARLFKRERYGIPDCKVSKGVMNYFLEFGDLQDKWNEYLENRAEEQYNENRG